MPVVYSDRQGPGDFVCSKFVENHAQEHRNDAAEQSNISRRSRVQPHHWKLAAMNMAFAVSTLIKKNADTFRDNQHPDPRADFIAANPPLRETAERVTGDDALEIRYPTKEHATCWIKYMFHHLAPTGTWAAATPAPHFNTTTNEPNVKSMATHGRSPPQMFTQKPAISHF